MRREIRGPADEALLSAKPHPDNVRVCPDCGAPTEVSDSRLSEEHGWLTVRRRRACPECDTRISTIEIQEESYRRFIRSARVTRETLRKALEDLESIR